jgi:hypothetical protein
LNSIGRRAANNLSNGRDFQLHGEIEEGQEEGCQRKGNQEGGSG